MEYQSEDVNGKLQWYSISGDSGIAEKVRDFMLLQTMALATDTRVTAHKIVVKRNLIYC